MNATSRRADATALAGRLMPPHPARRASLDNATQAIGADTRPQGEKERETALPRGNRPPAPLLGKRAFPQARRPSAC